MLARCACRAKKLRGFGVVLGSLVMVFSGLPMVLLGFVWAVPVFPRFSACDASASWNFV